MNWVLLIAGGLASVALLIYVIGLMLPKGHTSSRTLRLTQPPEPVWQVLADAAAMPSWRANVDRVERLPDQDGHEVWQEVYKDGWKLPLMRVSVEPPRKLVGKIADPKLPFGGTWTFEIQPVDGGCRVTITERGEVYSPVFRMLSQFHDMKKTISEYETYLARKFGEEPRFED